MPFAVVTANIAIANVLEFRAENLVMIKPSAVSVSVYHDAAMTKPVVSCPIGETTLTVHKNQLLAGPFYVKASADAQSVTFNWW